MIKNKIKCILEWILKNSKVSFPVVLIAAVALTVTLSLGMRENTALEEVGFTAESLRATDETEEISTHMILNENQEVTNLIQTYYQGLTEGDESILKSACDEISIQDLVSHQEKAKYIDHYTAFEIYTKPGYEEESLIAFVYFRIVFTDHPEEIPGYSAHYISRNEEGNLYIKGSPFTNEQNEYLSEQISQEDVLEFNNRVTVEYNELMVQHPDLLEYLSEMVTQVDVAVGEKLAEQNKDSAENNEEFVTDSQELEETATVDEVEDTVASTAVEEEIVEENTIRYVTTTTTVNVRSSDSEKADKLGKATGGSKFKVLEQRPNGWTKIAYNDKEGYIKTEYLQVVENVEGTESIGTVTALENVRIRDSASETAEKIGILVGGEGAELLAKENDWCKIKYDGRIGYVKAEYVR